MGGVEENHEKQTLFFEMAKFESKARRLSKVLDPVERKVFAR